MKKRTGRGGATPTDRPVINITRNMDLNPAFDARPRWWGCHRLNNGQKNENQSRICCNHSPRCCDLDLHNVDAWRPLLIAHVVSRVTVA